MNSEVMNNFYDQYDFEWNQNNDYIWALKEAQAVLKQLYSNKVHLWANFSEEFDKAVSKAWSTSLITNDQKHHFIWSPPQQLCKTNITFEMKKSWDESDRSSVPAELR